MSLRDKEFIGVICDGGRTHAMKTYDVEQKHELTRSQLLYGYQKGAQAIEGVMDGAVQGSIGTLALWALSDKNLFMRSEENLRAIFEMMHVTFNSILGDWIDRSANRNVRLVHVGKPLEMLPDYGMEAVESLKKLVEYTRERTGLVVAMCINYSGAEEQADAMQQWVDNNQQGVFQDYLMLPRILAEPYKPLDGVVRTGVPQGKPMRRAEFLKGYDRYQTAYLSNSLTLPEYTTADFLSDVELVRESNQKKPAV